ncbi:MAG TPA: DnaT-like ssDNA-binding protein [Candidatus Limnocylindria bacterium]|nr:DnaT-like ssDNA-binding protein [Candidatus Limnocylindria bacterium]
MAFVFDATVGGPAANSYVAVADADDYFGGRLNASAWTAASATTKQQALATATSRLEQLTFVGSRVTTAQRLAWPRYGAESVDGDLYASDAIPRPVFEATCELALDLLNAGTTDRLAPTGLEPFSALSVGAVSLSLRDDAPQAGELPPQVQRLLAPLLDTASGATRLVRA